jgi:hypothetical protein
VSTLDLFTGSSEYLHSLRAAELTTGILCVSFPEMGVLFSKKSRRRYRNHEPTASILQGSANSRSRKQRTQRETYISSTRAEAFAAKRDQNPYIELEEDTSYGHGVQIASSGTRDNLGNIMDNKVYVDHEVVVSSNHA